ncbi:MAG: GNAT family N-acetyltransferase [Bdellovibrionales bacterium]|nr:GNAT family N-acetyltransferase [Bdellovibrionales bacterium]
MELRRLTLADERAFRAALAETLPSDPEFAHQYRGQFPYAEYLRQLAAHERGEELPEGFVPGTVLYGFVGADCVGRLSIRHRLNPWLEKVGGHIGYVTVPSHRRRGYATEMLRQSLPFARALGITRALLTCDDDNQGSIRTIERCGGVLERLYEGPEVARPKRHYRVDL